MLRPIAVIMCLSLAPLAAQAQDDDEDVRPFEVVVTGRQPGPPLWKVSQGDHELWIFPYLSPVLKDMNWETDKAEAAIEGAAEVLQRPELTASASPLLLLNPINLVRGYRLARQLTRNPDDATLADVLPPDLYARYAALKEKYFPREKDFEEMRPLIVASRMERRVHTEEGLTWGRDVERTLSRLLRRNSRINYTDIKVDVEVKGSFRELRERAETMIDSLDPAAELACFEFTVRAMERDIEDRKYRADLWARGYADEFRMIPLDRTIDDPCYMLILGSSEQDNIAAAQAELYGLWVQEAERALAENTKTFAILDISDLIRADGPLAALKAKGYTVVEP